jgi:hypothetical protein
MALSANLKAALQAPGVVSAQLVDLVLPGGTRRYSRSHYSSLATGHYENKLLSLSPINDEISGRTGTIQASEITMEVIDTDRSLAALFTGASAHQVVGSAVTVRRAATTCAEADWSTRFTGVIANVGFGKELVATVRARTDDLALRKTMPRAVWLITPSEWPNAADDVYGKLYPMPYGVQSMAPYSGTGAIVCYLVDKLGFRYLLCAGRPKSVLRVYKDGVLQATSTYTVVFTTINGRACTLIDFTASQGDSVITADVEGYEATGDGSGALINTQTGVIAHLLSNFFLGDYRSGNWLSTHARIDSTLLSALEAILTAKGYEGAFALLERTTGHDVITRWNVNNETKAWWTPLGKLGFGMMNPAFTDIYNAAIPKLSHSAGFNFSSDDQAIVSSITVSYAQSPAEGQFMRTLEVSDPGGDLDAAETLDQPFGALE